MTISEALGAFLRELEKTVSQKTFKNYRSSMSYWVSFLARYHPDELQAVDV